MKTEADFKVMLDRYTQALCTTEEQRQIARWLTYRDQDTITNPVPAALLEAIRSTMWARLEQLTAD